MINIFLNGCNGKMGQYISQLAHDSKEFNIIAGCDLNTEKKNNFPVYNSPAKCKEQIDVVIDFSHPSVLPTLLDFCNKKNLPLVVATTGLSEDDIDLLKESAKTIPVFFSANMSLGINLLQSISSKIASILEDTFDIEIIEKHHNQKIDAPSGTAIAIADSINSALKEKHKYTYDRHLVREKREKNEIGIHSLRGGTIVGEHSVIFAGTDEVIEIKHEAMSKRLFASGALNVSKFIVNKPKGFYSMDDFFEL